MLEVATEIYGSPYGLHAKASALGTIAVVLPARTQGRHASHHGAAGDDPMATWMHKSKCHPASLVFIRSLPCNTMDPPSIDRLIGLTATLTLARLGMAGSTRLSQCRLHPSTVTTARNDSPPTRRQSACRAAPPECFCCRSRRDGVEFVTSWAARRPCPAPALARICDNQVS